MEPSLAGWFRGWWHRPWSHCAARIQRVQGKRFLGLTGPWGRRVLRFDGPMGRGLWYRRFAAMSFIECRSAAKPNNRACGAWKCTPSVACGDISPRESVSHDSQSPTAPYESCSLATPEGEILATLYFELLVRVKAERQVKFPLRGGKGTGFVGEQSDLRIQ